MSTKQFTAQTFAWLKLLKSDRDMTALAVGVQMIEHFNENEGGVARAGCKFMADALGLSESTVVRAVHRMHDRGRLRVEWGKQGRGHPNHYWMVVGKPAPVQVSEAVKPAPEVAVKPAPAPRKPAPAQENLSKNHIGAPTEPPIEGESRAALTRLDPDPGGRRADARPPDEGEGRFEALWTIWDRGAWIDPKGVGRRAYVAACARAAPDEIAAAAHAWISAADAPRFLPRLDRWLDGDGWRKPPPQQQRAKRQREHRNGHRHSGDDLARMMLALGAAS